MAGTAFDVFFQQAAEENLPAAVPVASEHGEEGVMTSCFNVRQNHEALMMSASPSPYDRALCAIYACRAVRLAVDTQTDLHSA